MPCSPNSPLPLFRKFVMCLTMKILKLTDWSIDFSLFSVLLGPRKLRSGLGRQSCCIRHSGGGTGRWIPESFSIIPLPAFCIIEKTTLSARNCYAATVVLLRVNPVLNLFYCHSYFLRSCDCIVVEPHAVVIGDAFHIWYWTNCSPNECLILYTVKKLLNCAIECL